MQKNLHLNKYIDHTLLDPSAPFGKYTELVRDAVKYEFFAVCINPFFVPLVHNLFKNHPECTTKICSVISFPFGLEDLRSKCEEANYVIAHGASELDLVANLSSIKSGDWKRFSDELHFVREEAQEQTLKIILEVGLLTDDEIKKACDISVENKFNFVKTSTGYLAKLLPEQTARYVKLMAECVKGSLTAVKASGGIKTLADLNLMTENGATRVGTSNSINIMQELENVG